MFELWNAPEAMVAYMMQQLQPRLIDHNCARDPSDNNEVYGRALTQNYPFPETLRLTEFNRRGKRLLQLGDGLAFHYERALLYHQYPEYFSNKPLFKSLMLPEAGWLEVATTALVPPIAYHVVDLVLMGVLGSSLKGWLLTLSLCIDYYLRGFLNPLGAAVMYFTWPYLFSHGGLNLASTLSITQNIVLRRACYFFYIKGIDGDSPGLILRDALAMLCMIGIPTILPIPPTCAEWPIPRNLARHKETRVFFLPIALLAAILSAWLLAHRFNQAYCWIRTSKLVVRIVYWAARLPDELRLWVLKTRRRVEFLINRWAAHRRTSDCAKLQDYPIIHDPGKQIRLLLIHPPHKTGLISAELIVRNLGDLPSFEAISYRWAGIDEVPILLQTENSSLPRHWTGSSGFKFMVSPTVYSILRSLQPKNSTRAVWIDSICIDQRKTDQAKEEKKWQIGLMREIYSSAAAVIGWMGDSPRTAGALSYVSRLVAVSEYGSHTDIQHHFRDWQIMDKYHPRWANIQQLLHQQWFGRVWIVQEVTLAQTFILRHRSGEELPWETLAKLGELLVTSEFASCLRDHSTYGVGITEDLYRNVTNLAAMNFLRNEYKAIPTGLNLGSVLSSTISFGATDLRDKVYGVLALASSETIAITADYNKDLRQVMLDTARDQLLRNSLASLHLAGAGYSQTTSETFLLLQLPSWCPDWLTTLQEKPALSSKGRKAATHLTPDVQSVKGQENQLLFKGVDLDEIEKFPSIGTFPVNNLDDLLNVVTDQQARDICTQVIQFVSVGLEFCAQAAQKHYNESSEDTFWRTLLTDSWPGERPIKHTTLKKAQDAWSHVTTPQASQGSAARVNSLGLIQTYMKLMTTFSASAKGKAICLTCDGRLALVPSESKIGDRICLISGAETPFVVRSSGGGHIHRDVANILIGACYVHGITHGELAERDDIHLEQQYMLFE
jgi:hypothetical protein